MKKVIDARGLACPGPVIAVKKALETVSQGILEVLVDNEIAVQNLKKLAAFHQIEVKEEKQDDQNYQVLFLIETEGVAAVLDEKKQSQNVVVISSECMGTGEAELGKLLMKGFIYALTELTVLPQTLLLYNGGAKLSVTGSESLADLQELERQGVEIMTCGTCLNYYGIDKQLAVGTVTNMYSIAEVLSQAGHILKP